MFRNLVTKKENLISYIVALFISLASLISGAMPFGTAFIGALVDQKVPIIFSFLIMIATTWFTQGAPSVLRFAVTVLIFAFLKSRYKDKEHEEPKLKVLLKFLIAQTVSLIIMLTFKVFEVALILPMIFEIIISTAFMMVFSKGLKPLLKIPKLKEIADDEQISSAIILTLLFAFLSPYSYLYMSIFSIISVIVLMFLCYKNSIRLSVIYSLFFGLLYVGISGDAFIFIALYLFVGVITALISRLGKKGLAIGLVFSLAYLLFLAPSKDEIYSRLDINPALMQDYYSFMQNSEMFNDSDELINPESFDSMNFNIDDEISEVINTPSVVIQRELLIGLIILLILPNSWLKKYERITRKKDYSREEFFTRVFNWHKVLLLPEGKPEEPIIEEKPKEDKSKSTKKQGESNKSSKKNKKKKRKILRFSAF